MKGSKEGADVLRLGSLGRAMSMVTKVPLWAFGQDFLGTIHRDKVPFTLILHSQHSWPSTGTEHVDVDIN